MTAASTRPPGSAVASKTADLPELRFTLPERLLATAVEIANEAALEAPLVDCISGFPKKAFRDLAEAGFLVAPLASDLGGSGWGFESSQIALVLQILKQIGRGNLSLGRVYEGPEGVTQSP